VPYHVLVILQLLRYDIRVLGLRVVERDLLRRSGRGGLPVLLGLAIALDGRVRGFVRWIRCLRDVGGGVEVPWTW
jgi:hypothetical protein